MRGRVSARGKAGGKRRTSLRRRIFSILSFVMSFLLFFAAACPNGTLTLAEDSGTYDFTGDITSALYMHIRRGEPRDRQMRQKMRAFVT